MCARVYYLMAKPYWPIHELFEISSQSNTHVFVCICCVLYTIFQRIANRKQKTTFVRTSVRFFFWLFGKCLHKHTRTNLFRFLFCNHIVDVFLSICKNNIFLCEFGNMDYVVVCVRVYYVDKLWVCVCVSVSERENESTHITASAHTTILNHSVNGGGYFHWHIQNSCALVFLILIRHAIC